MKKIIAVFMASALFFSLCACAKDTNSTSDKGSDNMNGKYSSAASAAMKEEYLKTIYTDFGVDFSENVNVRITVDGYGEIELELYPEIAPVTVRNFVYLVKSGFYNGLTFHRVIDGFMIQGGDPDGNGTGGSEYSIYGEFSANGFEGNTLNHEVGVISMARSNDNNSASSQFFICDADASHLDGQYAGFGKVTKGIDVVHAIADCEKLISCPMCGTAFEKDTEAEDPYVCPDCGFSFTSTAAKYGYDVEAFVSSYISAPKDKIVMSKIEIIG